MIKRDFIEQALIKAVQMSVSKDITVVIAEELIDENRPKPPKPYITIKIITGPTPNGSDENLRTDGAGFVLSSQRTFTVSFQAFGVGGYDSLSLFQTRLFDMGFRQDGGLNVGEFLRSLDISVDNRGSVTDISAALSTGFERRASFDGTFSIANNEKTDLQTIETVVIGGTLIKEDETTQIIDNFEVSKP